MGKIVKYCSSCDEGFAEKFGFCPDCGAQLQAFEMSPLGNQDETVSSEPTLVESEIDATPVAIEPEVPAPVFLQDEEVAEEIDEPAYEAEAYEAEAEEEEEWVDEPEEEFVAPAAAVAAPSFYQTSPMYADRSADSLDESTNWDYTHPDDNGFYVTVIQEKNAGQRNMLLLGSTALILTLAVG